MPRYQLRYRVQTCLRKEQNVSITSGAHTVNLLFAEKEAEQGTSIIAELETEAQNNRQAQLVAAGSVIPPVLDALSFSTGTPLLLENCEVILKNEKENDERRLIYRGRRKAPFPADLTDGDIENAKQVLLPSGEHSIAACWHRYAQVRQFWLDRFLFQWLAFEVLAGDADVETPCPNCGNKTKHRGSNKQRAFELFHAAAPQYERARFNREIWGRMRNAVFHGGRYPAPTFLSELVPITETLRQACELEISRLSKVAPRAAPPRPLEQTYLIDYFASWITKSRNEPYAQDYPAGVLAKMVEEAAVRAPDGAGLNLIYTDSSDW